MNYVDSKFRIIQNQTTADALIYCFDDEIIVTELAKRNVQSKLILLQLINHLSKKERI